MPPTPSRLRIRPSTAIIVGVPLVYLAVFCAFMRRVGDADWDQLLSFHELSLWNWRLSGLEKQWNPLMAGGMSLAGDPQVPIFSLSMIFARIMDPTIAIKLACIAFLLIGGMGAYLFSRQLGIDRRTAALAGALFAGNGYIISRLSHGHITFLGTLTLPIWLWASRYVAAGPGEPPIRAARQLALLVLGGGVLLVLSTDGAPISLLLLLTWVGLDAAIVGVQRRTALPIMVFAGSLILALCLDAIYFLPLFGNALIFPRARPLVFIDPLILFWFLVLPIRGKVLPAPANGHEFSIYIGPVLTYLIIRYRSTIWRATLAEERTRLAIGSVFAFVVGIGSWRVLGRWMPPSPFDLLHHLPGFVSVGIPGRFWGFLALPLALAGAIGIRSLEAASAGSTSRILWGLLFASTLGFQLISISEPFLGRAGKVVVAQRPVPSRVTRIQIVAGGEEQAATIAPTVGILDAYNSQEYVKGDIATGTSLVRTERDARGGRSVEAHWTGWSGFRVEFPTDAPAGTLVVFNQNWHPFWSSTAGLITRNGAGNLCLRLHAPWRGGRSIDVTFVDRNSIVGGRVSAVTAAIVAIAAAALVAWRPRLPRADESFLGPVERGT